MQYTQESKYVWDHRQSSHKKTLQSSFQLPNSFFSIFSRCFRKKNKSLDTSRMQEEREDKAYAIDSGTKIELKM